MQDDSVMPTYKRLPVAFSHGENVWLYDTEGQRYLDALGGIAVCALGHAHPAISHAICEQAGRLLHSSNLYEIPLQSALANKLCQLSGLDKVFFCNSGAEANETAIKIARRYAHQRNITAPVIVVMEGAFHGRTLATLTATANPKAQEGFGPLVPGFLRVAYDDIAALEALQDSNIVAVLVEPIQGEGGIRVPQTHYLKRLRELCDQRQWLLMLDEIQSGIGRTGQWFAFQHDNILPDVMTIAKALGNGVPIGACLARGVAAEQLQAGSHGTTFGGNPLAARAALAVIETIENESLIVRTKSLGERMLRYFQKAFAQQPRVTRIQGKGLMLGIELDRDCPELVTLALARKLLINVTAGRVIRLLPPYILTDQAADEIAEQVVALVNDYLTQHPA
ncbi:MAG: aspartate aminotransferase family protein [Gammaproteobacteria bacterium]|nr:aspartate aminotransferase family protein [Gammaproteobacteria bacterium]